METVNFKCGHCDSLMGVARQFLGRPVRCPHCQQVVLAPAPAPESLPGDEFFVPPRDEVESIFSPPEEVGDDLFGGPAKTLVEMPPEPLSPERPTTAPATQVGWPPLALDPPAAATPDGPTLTYLGSQAPSPGPATEPMTAPLSPAPAPASPPTETADEGLPAPVVRASKVSRGSGWVLALVIVPLVSYCILATVAIILLRSQLAARPHPLEHLPDLEGDHPGATRGKKKAEAYRVVNPETTELPDHLRVRLGEKLAVGDVEVTPLQVETRRITFDHGGRLQQASEDCLALVLWLRNRSADVTFRPLDRYFARRWKPGDGVGPFTILEMGTRRFHGGPTPWPPPADERLAGQDFDKELKPGETMTTFVCTNPDDHAVKALAGYKGPLTWRVQLRRGLVRWQTSNGVDREDPATVVVGVEFNASDVRKEGG
jgi:hypothetical protein